MNNLIGKTMSLQELCDLIGCNFEALNETDILSGEQVNIDNFNGETGISVYFEIRGSLVKITDVIKI